MLTLKRKTTQLIHLAILLALLATSLVSNQRAYAQSSEANDSLSADSCITPPANMVAWYTFDDASSPTVDDLIGPNNGTYYGTTSINEWVANGREFDGVDDYVGIPHAPEIDFDTGDFSIDAWIRTDDMDPYNSFIDKRGNTSVGYEMLLYNGRLTLEMADTVNGWANYYSTSSAKINDGEWHFVAATVDRDQPDGGKLYVDGVQVHQFDPTSHAGSLSNTADLYIGRRHSNSASFAGDIYYQGAMDEVELFDRALEAEEVEALYEAGQAGKCKQDSQPYIVYGEDPTNIYVWYRDGSIPDLNVDYDLHLVAAPTSCTPTSRPDLVTLPDGDFLAIWYDDGCYSRFKNLGVAGFVEIDLGNWDPDPLWRVSSRHSAADLDGDGLSDLLLIWMDRSKASDQKYKIASGLPTNGDFDFTGTSITYRHNWKWSTITLGDINGDNKLDIVFIPQPHGGTFTTQVYARFGNGLGGFAATDTLIITAPTNVSSLTPVVADYDEDGDMDVWLSPDDDTSISGLSYMAINDGDGVFTTIEPSFDFAPTVNGPDPDVRTASGEWCDVDLDSHVDIIGRIISNNSWRYSFHKGNGMGALVENGPILHPTHATFMATCSRGLPITASASGQLYIDPATVHTTIGDSVVVEVAFDAGSTIVKGVDIDLAFDPSLVSVSNVALGSCLDVSITNNVNNAAGTIEFAAVSTGAGCTAGDAAKITVQGVSGGISPVAFTAWDISDGLGNPIALAETDGSVEVLTSGNVTGRVELQGRTDHAGATVTLWDGATAVATDTTDSAGNYTLIAPAGTYVIRAEHTSYLDGEKLGIVTIAGNTTTVNTVTLLAGDVIINGCVDIFDLAAIAGQFGQSVPPVPANLDLNADGVINILDVALAASNYDTCEPIPWP